MRADAERDGAQFRTELIEKNFTKWLGFA